MSVIPFIMSAAIVEIDGEKYYKVLGDVFVNERGQEERKLFYTKVPSTNILAQLNEAINTEDDVPPGTKFGETGGLTAEEESLLADALCE